MKHIFVINPAAGSNSDKSELIAKINSLNVEKDIYLTKCEKDATSYVRTYIELHGDENVRFYACGGDGIINEVANGLVGTKAEFTVIPCGTGNDFVKAFGGAEVFTVDNLVDGTVGKIDAMKVDDVYCINVCNFGFDAIVAKTANELKLKGKKNAYVGGIVKAIFTGMHNKVFVEADGELLNEKGKMLLCTLANGQYVGGQFFCAPRSKANDGLIDVCIVKVISIFKFLSILGIYTEGKHFEDKKCAKILKYRQATKITMYADEDFYVCIDGEMLKRKEYTVEMVPSCINFVYPKAN